MFACSRLKKKIFPCILRCTAGQKAMRKSTRMENSDLPFTFYYPVKSDALKLLFESKGSFWNRIKIILSLKMIHSINEADFNIMILAFNLSPLSSVLMYSVPFLALDKIAILYQNIFNNNTDTFSYYCLILWYETQLNLLIPCKISYTWSYNSSNAASFLSVSLNCVDFALALEQIPNNSASYFSAFSTSTDQKNTRKAR